MNTYFTLSNLVLTHSMSARKNVCPSALQCATVLDSLPKHTPYLILVHYIPYNVLVIGDKPVAITHALLVY